MTPVLALAPGFSRRVQTPTMLPLIIFRVLQELGGGML
jgi:hypothetical protein